MKVILQKKMYKIQYIFYSAKNNFVKMKNVQKLKQIYPNEYARRLDNHAENIGFKFNYSDLFLKTKNFALLNVPQAFHRLDYEEILWYYNNSSFNVLQISKVMTLIQQLNVNAFNSSNEYFELLKETSSIAAELQAYYNGIDNKIEKELQDEMNSEKAKVKLVNMNGGQIGEA